MLSGRRTGACIIGAVLSVEKRGEEAGGDQHRGDGDAAQAAVEQGRDVRMDARRAGAAGAAAGEGVNARGGGDGTGGHRISFPLSGTIAGKGGAFPAAGVRRVRCCGRGEGGPDARQWR